MEDPNSPLLVKTSRIIIAIFVITFLWALIAKVDIIAEAPGKLIPTTFVKIVQPSDAGVVSAILVTEGDEVKKGQPLIRLDPGLNEADRKASRISLAEAKLTVRRIDAELGGQPFARHPEDPADLFYAVDLQYESHKRAYQDTLAQEKAALVKLQADRSSAQSAADVTARQVPLYRESEDAFVKLEAQGYAGHNETVDKRKERLEKEKELASGRFQVQSLGASIVEQQNKILQVTSDYRKDLLQLRADTVDKMAQYGAEVDKAEYKAGYLELKAPQDGIVKDLATHTVGSVVSPGTTLVTLVPKTDSLQAEVFVKNDDIGFVYPTQEAKVKVAALPFQQFGLVDGSVSLVTADSNDADSAQRQSRPQSDEAAAQATAKQDGYRTLVKLKTQQLTKDGKPFDLKPGMQVVAEVKLGRQTVLQYLLSPVQKTLHESIREK
jgi:HlyD family secretion protein